MTTADGEGYAISQSYQAVSGQLAGISRVCGNTGENVDLAMSYQGDLLRSMTYSGAVSGGVSYTYDDFFSVPVKQLHSREPPGLSIPIMTATAYYEPAAITRLPD